MEDYNLAREELITNVKFSSYLKKIYCALGEYAKLWKKLEKLPFF